MTGSSARRGGRARDDAIARIGRVMNPRSETRRRARCADRRSARRGWRSRGQLAGLAAAMTQPRRLAPDQHLVMDTGPARAGTHTLAG